MTRTVVSFVRTVDWLIDWSIDLVNFGASRVNACISYLFAWLLACSRCWRGRFYKIVPPQLTSDCLTVLVSCPGHTMSIVTVSVWLVDGSWWWWAGTDPPWAWWVARSAGQIWASHGRGDVYSHTPATESVHHLIWWESSWLLTLNTCHSFVEKLSKKSQCIWGQSTRVIGELITLHCVHKKTPTHSFFHISVNDVCI